MVFCLFHLRSRIIVLRQSVMERLFPSSKITPRLWFIVCMIRSNSPQPRWSLTEQNFCSMLFSVQNFVSVFPLNHEI